MPADCARLMRSATPANALQTAPHSVSCAVFNVSGKNMWLREVGCFEIQHDVYRHSTYQRQRVWWRSAQETSHLMPPAVRFRYRSSFMAATEAATLTTSHALFMRMKWKRDSARPARQLGISTWADDGIRTRDGRPRLPGCQLDDRCAIGQPAEHT